MSGWQSHAVEYYFKLFIFFSPVSLFVRVENPNLGSYGLINFRYKLIDFLKYK